MTTRIRVSRHFEMKPTNYEEPPPFTWREFYDFRNHTIRVLRNFGSAGPLGEANLASPSEDPDLEGDVVDDPEFYVIDDMYNEHDKISMAGCKPSLVTMELIEAVSEMAAGFPGWAVNFDLDDSAFRVSSSTLIWSGRRFWDCETVEHIADRCSRPVDFGPSGPFPESMYPVWAAVISGEYLASAPHDEPPDRQWSEVVRELKHLALTTEGGRLNYTHYRQIKHDIHPETRRQFTIRFLSEMASFSPERLKGARSNLFGDAVDALLLTPDPDEARSLIDSISDGQHASVGKIDDRDILLWWSEIFDKVPDPNESLKSAFEAKLRTLLDKSLPLAQLSAVFGLARLQVSDIASVVDSAMRANEQWLLNDELTKWLLKLRAGSSGWPKKTILG